MILTSHMFYLKVYKLEKIQKNNIVRLIISIYIYNIVTDCFTKKVKYYWTA